MLWVQFLVVLAGCEAVSAASGSGGPTVVDKEHQVTYQGLDRNGIEVFLGIPYGQDTGGENRFKPPQPYTPTAGDTIPANSYGPACPQVIDTSVGPFSVNVTSMSEDCLNLNIARPRDTKACDGLPVLVYIYGGSLWQGQNSDIKITPDGMILESVENGLPIIHVAMNYRLGVFGFAQSDALQAEGSENAGLRDQRLAIEWVRDHIAHFGGNPNNITISGQSSGGLSVGMQILAYGGSTPAPFQRAICESQALEPGLTGTFAIDAMTATAAYAGCISNSSSSSNGSDVHAPETVACLRTLDMEAVLNASVATHVADGAHNLGDTWLPAVDGDFLPDAPSRLARARRFANVTVMIGWCQDDVNPFTDTTIVTANDTYAFLSGYAGHVTSVNMDRLLSLYPVEEFAAMAPAGGLSAEFYRAARVLRDILMTCQPIWLGEQLAAADNTVYLYEWNQTVLGSLLEYAYNLTGMGVIHTSEFAYVFGNLSHYNSTDYAFEPTAADYDLVHRGSRSWSTFASVGQPGLAGRDTFQGFTPAWTDAHPNQTYVFVAGGTDEGLSALDGSDSRPVVAAQRLRERCAFINSDEMIEQLQY